MLRILKCERTLNEDSDIAPLTCCMVTSDKFDPDVMKINLHGTLIVQAMLNFGKPIKIINSLLNMETKHLLEIISDPRGCHIVDAFIQSPTVGEKSRDRLFKKLLVNMVQSFMNSIFFTSDTLSENFTFRVLISNWQHPNMAPAHWTQFGAVLQLRAE